MPEPTLLIMVIMLSEFDNNIKNKIFFLSHSFEGSEPLLITEYRYNIDLMGFCFRGMTFNIGMVLLILYNSNFSLL